MSAEPHEGAWEIKVHGLSACAQVPLTDRGFRFGQHFFETIAVRCGRWLFFSQHLEILQAAANEASFQCDPVVLDRLKALPSAPELESLQEGIARIYWTAGDGAPGSPPASGRIFLLWEKATLPVNPGPLSILPEPFEVRILGGSLGAWKSGNYWQNLLARERAIAGGFDEIFLTNAEQRICGVSMGNVFFRLGERWFTPPLCDGARPGTTRQWLLGKGFARESSLRADEVAKVEAWAVSNARIGPVAAFVGATELKAEPPEIHALRDAWHAL